jgi:signal transduction histidine kinase
MHDAAPPTGSNTCSLPSRLTVDGRKRNAGPLVLNVNDNDASRYLVTRMLERGGFNVIEAATGRGALDRVRNDQPRLVVLDIKLPDMNGLEVCRRIKADPHTHSVKVLHTSAVFVATEFKVQSLECGADGYLSHPFEQEELTATVRSLLRLTEVEQELRDQAEELKAANRRTNEFLAMLAHELRNPLAAIVTSLPLLERSSAQDTVEKTARELIRRQTTHLRRLVDDLLDAARVTQGKIDLHWESLDVTDLVRRITANVQQTKFAPRSQALRVTVPNTPLYVRGDPMRLEQVLTNLLDNASKYSNSGDVIDFGLMVGRSSGGPSEVHITVRDRGIGMDPHTLPTIFDLFSQADVPLARSRGGLGIGLTLVRTLVELHGGKVHARSDGLGRGSEFEIVLPLLAEDTRVAPAGSDFRPSERTTPRSRRVLIVEDNQDAQDALRCLLEIWGHDVMVAGDGVAGIRLATTNRPDIALVDLGLPTVDGYEVARQVRATLGAASPLLIALTGYGAPEQRSQALAAGFDLHIVKPVEPDRLSALLEEYAATPPSSASHSAPRPPVNAPH